MFYILNNFILNLFNILNISKPMPELLSSRVRFLEPTLTCQGISFY